MRGAGTISDSHARRRRRLSLPRRRQSVLTAAAAAWPLHGAGKRDTVSPQRNARHLRSDFQRSPLPLPQRLLRLVLQFTRTALDLRWLMHRSLLK